MKQKPTQTVMLPKEKTIGDLGKPIGEMSYDEFLSIWQHERRKYFIRLSRSGMTYEQIAEKEKVSRQSIGKLLGPKKEWES